MSFNEGILLIDKPTGLTSHNVVDIVRKKLQVKKVGHTGTLDPLATGLLIILVGRQYTKRQDEFLKQDKQYQVTVKLGEETDTYDSDGEVVKKTPLVSSLTQPNNDTEIKIYFLNMNRLSS